MRFPRAGGASTDGPLRDSSMHLALPAKPGNNDERQGLVTMQACYHVKSGRFRVSLKLD